MAGRYLVTGVQLGMLKALEDKAERDKLVDDIINDQFVGNSDQDIKDDVREITGNAEEG